MVDREIQCEPLAFALHMHAPGTAERKVVLPRKKITLETQAAKKDLKKIKRGDKELRIGVITVPSFYQDFNARSSGDADYRSTTRDVRRLIEELLHGREASFFVLSDGTPRHP